jgi:hypothetical protein
VPATIAKPVWGVLRLTGFVAAVALATTRLGLVAHELVGHGGTANVVGASVTDVRLFWFAGGWIRYDGDWTWTSAVIVQLGGIAIELVLAIALLVLARTRLRVNRWARLAATGAAGGMIVHAGFYLAAGTWHGFGDGVLLHRLLGDARVAVAIPAAIVVVTAAYLVARALVAPLAAAAPFAGRGARLGALAIASVVALGAHAGLAAAELAVRRDADYAAIMRPERDREIDREMARWLATRPRAVDAAEVAARRRALEAADRPFPFAIVLGIATALAALAGAARSRDRDTASPALDRRTVAVAGVLAAAAITLVVAADAVFPL